MEIVNKEAADKSKGGQAGEGEGGDGTVSREDVEKLIDTKVNAAMSNHLTRFKASFGKDLNEQFGKLLGPLSEQLKGLGETVAASREKEHPEGKKDEMPDSVRHELAKRDAKIRELEEARIKAEREKDEERSARMKDEERSELTKHLSAKGIEGAKMRAAMALIYIADQRVARDDEGKIVFKIKKPGYEEHLTLEEGVEEWLKTDEGKEFLPARPAGGAGAGPAKPQLNGKGGGKMTQSEAKTKLAELLGVIPPGSGGQG